MQFKVPNLDHELYADYQELRVQRTRTDDELAAWVDSLTDEALQAPFEFKSFVNPKSHRCPLWVAVAHLFNHQTHHRGQLTTLLSECGEDYGAIDPIWLPDLVQEDHVSDS